MKNREGNISNIRYSDLYTHRILGHIEVHGPGGFYYVASDEGTAHEAKRAAMEYLKKHRS